MAASKNVNVSAQMNELDKYMEVRQLADSVLDNFSDTNNINMNDVYDIVYINNFANDIIKRGVDNNDVRSAMQDLYDRTSVIIELLNENILKKAKENSKEITKNDKAKVDRVDKTKFTNTSNKSITNIAEPNVRIFHVNSIGQYMKSKIIALIVVFMLLMVSMTNIFNPTVNEDNTDSTVSIESEQEVEHDSTTSLTEFAPTPLSNSAMAPIMRMMGTILRLVCTIATVGLSICVCIDIMYLTFPVFRIMVDSNKDGKSSLVSSTAKQAAKESEIDKREVSFNKSNKYNRIERAENIYKNFAASESEFKALGKPASEICSNISNILKNKSKKDTIEYIKNIAKAEIIYNNNIEICDKIFENKKAQLIEN